MQKYLKTIRDFVLEHSSSIVSITLPHVAVSLQNQMCKNVSPSDTLTRAPPIQLRSAYLLHCNYYYYFTCQERNKNSESRNFVKGVVSRKIEINRGYRLHLLKNTDREAYRIVLTSFSLPFYRPLLILLLFLSLSFSMSVYI